MKNAKDKNNSKSARERKSRRTLTTVHILIAVVALIECFVLLSFTTYSWIESSSSLIISTGEQGTESMKVGDYINYRVNIAADAALPADMTTFYRTVKYFRFAKASSADGEHFFFPKKNGVNSSLSGYRAGDTADYNISYTYFDFKLINESGGRKEFYYKQGVNLFKAVAEEGESVGSEITENIENAMRISFKQDSSNAKIYSLTGTQTNGVMNSTSSSTNVTPTAVSYATYTSGIESLTPSRAIFSMDPNDNESTVSVRIWLEEKALSSDAIAALNKVKISVDLELVSDNIVYDQIYLDDYTISSDLANLGGFNTESGQTLYFWAYNNNVRKYIAYPMSLTDNDDNASIPRWVTSCPVYYVFKNLTSNTTYYQNCFFGYGALPDSGTSATPNQTPIYKWKLPGYMSVAGNSASDENAKINTGYDMVSAIGLAKGSANPATITGYSAWNKDVTPVELRFADYTTAYTTLDYNQSGTKTISGTSYDLSNSEFINESAIGSNDVRNLNLYAAGASDSASTAAVSFYYDESNGYFKCYVPQSWITGGNLYLRYNNNGYYSTSSKVVWHPAAYNETMDSYTYSALGYSGTSTVPQCNNTTGYGTWGSVRSVNFSTELIDATIDKDNIYRVCTDDDSYVPMVPTDASCLTFTAYIPDGESDVYFTQTIDETTNSWSSAITDDDTTYYPIDSSHGYFHISVLVDATYNKLFSTIFSENQNATLTADGTTITTQKIDDYRWYVPCNASTSSVTYVWTPYPDTNTSFTYTHYLADGIYYYVTE